MNLLVFHELRKKSLYIHDTFYLESVPLHCEIKSLNSIEPAHDSVDRILFGLFHLIVSH